MRRKYFEIGEDAQQFYIQDRRKKEKRENIAYFCMCLIMLAVFIYQFIMQVPQEPPVQNVEAQTVHSGLEGGDNYGRIR